MKNASIFAVFVLVMAIGITDVSAVDGGTATQLTESANQSALVLQLDALQDFIERLDQLLEALVDLLETLSELFGGEGEGGGDD